ncbi:MAG: hypothetical protein WCG48_01400 [Candidatus Berkelbacteria bacterium]
MKIVICGSINCSDKLIEAADELTKLGHEVELPFCTKQIKNGEITLEEFKRKKEQSGDAAFRAAATEDLIKRYWRLIGESDGILVVNTEKNGVKNYIGGNSLLELGFAYVLDKPIYLLNDIPEIGYKDEILAMKPIVLNGDLGKIGKASKKKIMIGGSMVFAKEMKAAKKFLEDEGFEVFVPLDTEHVIIDPSKKTDVAFMKELGVGRGDAELVAKADALVILNYEKHGVEGYIGPGAYRDISVSWWLHKKLFFLFPYDENQNNQKYEMLGFDPIILDGDLGKIKKSYSSTSR